MKTVRFTFDPQTAYKCSEPNDQSGEYVAAKTARWLAAALRDACERMERARRLLTKDDPKTDRNWGMLDTTDLRKILAETEGSRPGKSVEDLCKSRRLKADIAIGEHEFLWRVKDRSQWRDNGDELVCQVTFENTWPCYFVVRFVSGSDEVIEAYVPH